MSTIDELVNAIAEIQHNERPCLENLLCLKKLEMEREPVDRIHREAVTKVDVWKTEIVNLNSWSFQWFLLKLTCGLQAEKDRAAKGLTKAEELIIGTKKDVDEMDDKIHDVENVNEKYAVEHRRIQKYREDLSVLLDKALKDGFPGEDSYKEVIEGLKEDSNTKFDNISKIAEVKKLLKVADNSLLEGILELRGTNKESNIAQGKVYFPDEAYMALKAARELYPELPSIESPTEYKNEADDTGAYYSPLQKYLWDVRKKIAELTTWCDMESLVLLDKETETQITLGTKIDEYNMERRRIVKEGGLF